MKKIFTLIFISFALASCNDDDINKATILEGDWLLIHQYGGDPDPDDEPLGDISKQNIKYHFKGNIQKITKNDQIIHNDITFKIINEGDHYMFTYKDPEFNQISKSRVTFSNNNTIAFFTAMNIDAGYTLQKIQ